MYPFIQQALAECCYVPGMVLGTGDTVLTELTSESAELGLLSHASDTPS